MKKYFKYLLFMLMIVLIQPNLSFAQDDNHFMGNVDEIRVFSSDLCNKTALISGWVGRLEGQEFNDSPLLVIFSVDGQDVGYAYGDEQRNDVASVYGDQYIQSGFNWLIPAKYYDGQEYDFDAYVTTSFSEYNDHINTWSSNREYIGSIGFDGKDEGLVSSIDLVEGDRIVGWAVDLDGFDVYFEHVPVLVYGSSVNGYQSLVGQGIADLDRVDVENYFEGCAVGAHGFNISLDFPLDANDLELNRLHIYAVNQTEMRLERIGGYKIDVDQTNNIQILEPAYYAE